MNISQQYVKRVAESFLNGDIGIPVPIKLLSEWGRCWDTSTHLDTEDMSTRGECYRNAFLLSVERGWTYVEGYAVSGDLGLPLGHAWCITPEGELVDPTWENGSNYFGVLFNADAVSTIVSKTKYYGVLNNLYMLRQSIEETTKFLLSGIIQEKGECQVL